METRCLNCMKLYDDQYEVCPYCGFIAGTPPKEMYHLHPGIRLQDRYVVGTVVGFGGFGIIYRAWDERLDTMVAIKEFYPAGIVQRIPGEKEVIIYAGNGKKEFENGISRFLDEARNMAKFSTHSNIMNVYDFFEENNTAYIVMEFLHGISLKQYVKTMGGRIEVNQAIEIISAVCDALKDIHKEGIIHRDISPDNIFICEGGKIKLIDFGAARFSTGEEEKTLSIILKPGFAPPEQYRSKSKQGPWTDVYALAATMYRIVTGVVPEESVNRIVEDNLQAPNEIDPQLSENFSNAIMKGMALNQDLRFQSIQEFQDAIQNKKKITDLNKELKKRKQKRVVGIAIVGLLLIVGGIISFQEYQEKREAVDLPATTISIWLPADSEDEVESNKEMILDMVEKFQEDQPLVQVEVTCIPVEEYEGKLQEAMATDTMPTIFASDGLDESVLEEAASVNEVFQYVDTSEYYFLNDYKKYYPSGKQLPMGFTVPVVYVRRGMGVDIDTIVIEEYEQLQTGENPLNYYIEPEACNLVWSSFDGELINNGEQSDGFTQLQIAYRDDLGNGTCGFGDNDTAMQLFIDGEITYYVGTTEDFRLMNEKMAGMYEMRPLNTDMAVGEFTNCYSISGQASKDDQHAAAVLLSYMLAPGPQKTMHIIHKNAIPLNQNAYEEFVNSNGKFEIVSDYYLDTLVFEGEEQSAIEKRIESE